MKLQDVATIRTGVVTSRKKLTNFENSENKYVLLTLRCVSPLGYLDLQYAEEFYASEELKMEYLTQRNDILIRLSAPYTAILITKDEWCGCLVPSHFAIIRCNEDRVLPEYLLWFLRRETTRQQILLNISGSGAFGTINSGFFNLLTIRDLPLEKQFIIGQMQVLSEREQELLHKLAHQKEIYNRLLVNRIYDSVKRSN